MKYQLNEKTRDKPLRSLAKSVSLLDNTIEYLGGDFFDHPKAAAAMSVVSDFSFVSVAVPSALSRVQPYEFNQAASLVKGSIMPRMETLISRIDSENFSFDYEEANEALEKLRAAVDEFLANAPAEPAPASPAPQAAAATASM
ncbi:MAG: hypothetical protein AAF204_03060 [Pseudomonadota bacterium]